MQDTSTDSKQASSARTGRRSSGVRPRPRVATRRRNKRVRYDGRDGVGSLVRMLHRGHDGVAMGMIIVYIYEECSKNSCTGRQDGTAFEIS